MKQILFTYIILALGVFGSATGQTTTPPTTKMTHPVYKSFLDLFMDYPQDELDKKEEGKVDIVFETDPNGKVINRTIKAGVSSSIDSTALSIFDLILWKPGNQSGKDVTSTGIYSIDFKKNKYLKLAKKRGYLHPPKQYFPFDSSGRILSLKKTEQAPSFHLNDSTTSLSQYIYENLNYPETAEKLGISGQVRLKFVVELNGLPSNIEAEEFVGAGCTEEAIQLLEQTRWIPGKNNGLYVRTLHRIVITFEKGEHRGKPIPSQSNSGI